MVLRFPSQNSVVSKVILGFLLLAWWTGSGCSVTGYVKGKAADVVAQSGTTFSSDDDPELVKAAAPFSLKLMESLLADNPKHAGLLTATASGFTQYSYAFVQQEADEIEPSNFAAAEKMRVRARKLYQRAQRYGLRGLEVLHPGFEAKLLANPKSAVKAANKADVSLLYWTAAAWAATISLSKDNPELIGQIPAMEALIYRALELDEAYGDGAIHGFLITYEMGRPGAGGDPVARARQHFDRAVSLSQTNSAAPFVALAEAVTIQKQDVKEFESLLNQALAISPDAVPENRLLNAVMQNRARWLLSRKSELFLVD